MKKYIKPTVKNVKINTADIIKTSGLSKLNYGSPTKAGVDLGNVKHSILN